jgi:hypothetical protein
MVAASAYRLLDPRYRFDVYERVQLSFPLQRMEMDLTVTSVGDLMNVPEPLYHFSEANSPEPLDSAEPVRDSSLDSARELVRFFRRMDLDESQDSPSRIRRFLAWLTARFHRLRQA